MMSKKKEKEDRKEQQLDLGIKEPFKNRFFKIKNKISLAILKFEVKKFLKDPLLWASLVICLILISHQIYTIANSFDTLPKYLPIFRHFISIPRKLVEKEYIVIFPIISFISLLLSLIFTSRYYNTEKVLTKFLLFSAILCTIAQSLIIIHLITIF